MFHLLLHLTQVLAGVSQVLPGGGRGEFELLQRLVQLRHGTGVAGRGRAGQSSSCWEKIVSTTVYPSQGGALVSEIMKLLRQLSCAKKNQFKPPKAPSNNPDMGGIYNGSCPFLEVCCYGIDLGTSIVRFNQWKRSIWTDLDQWEYSTLWTTVRLDWLWQSIKYQGKIGILASETITSHSPVTWWSLITLHPGRERVEFHVQIRPRVVIVEQVPGHQ